MAKKFLICLLGMILMSLTINADETRNELITALIESTQLLEEQTLLNEKLQNDISEYKNQMNSLVQQYQKYPILIEELRIEFKETRNSFNDYLKSNNDYIVALVRQNSRYRFISIVSASAWAGTTGGFLFDRPLEGIALGVLVGIITGGVDYLFK